MKKIAGVLFDKDGVLVDFDATWGPATGRVIAHFSQGDAGKARKMAEAVEFDLETERFAPTSTFIAGTGAQTLVLWAKVLEMKDDAALAFSILDRMTEEGVHCVAVEAAAPTALTRLGEMRLALGIATNDQEISARRQMQKLGLAGRFAFVAGADSGHGAKPKPGMIHAFAEHIDAHPSRIVMVGDSLHDINAGKAAGAITVGVGTGPASLDSLAPHADHVIETMDALPGLVAQLSGR